MKIKINKKSNLNLKFTKEFNNGYFDNLIQRFITYSFCVKVLYLCLSLRFLIARGVI